MAVTVLSYIARDAGTQGLMTIPCVLGQVSGPLYPTTVMVHTFSSFAFVCHIRGLDTPIACLFVVPDTHTRDSPLLLSTYHLPPSQLAQIFLGSAIAHRLSLWVDAMGGEGKAAAGR